MRLTDDQQVIIAMCIVMLVGFLVYWFYLRPNDAKRRKEYREVYRESKGGFDPAAQRTLELIKEIENPVAEDDFVAGTILELNVLQGNIGHARENRDVANQIITRYRRTLNDINNGRVENAADPNHIPTLFMIDHIDNFVERGINTLNEFYVDDEFLRDIIPQLENMHEGVVFVRENIKEDVAKKAATTALNRADYTDKFVSLATTHTSDTQNVHDSSVVKDLQITYDAIKQRAPPTPAEISITEAHNYIKANPTKFDCAKANRALLALEIIKSGTKLDTYNDREDNIFKYVWERSKLPENEKNQELMRQAAVTALAECKPEDQNICVVGRVEYLMGSLATLDFDPIIGTALTQEQYRNDILEKTKGIRDQAVADALASSDTDLRDVARSFVDLNVTTKQDAEERFKQNVSSGISTMLETYRPHLSSTQFEAIEKDCNAAIL
jgi:hypothetical protein